MRFFLDENFPSTAKKALEDLGHEVIRALDHCRPGMGDRALFSRAQRDKAVFLTTDKDFFHTIPFLWLKRTAAVVSFALRQPCRSRILTRLRDFLAVHDPAEDPQAVFLVTDTKIIKKR